MREKLIKIGANIVSLDCWADPRTNRAYTLGMGNVENIRNVGCVQTQRLAVTTSKMIAGLIGPTLVAIAAGMLLNLGSFPELAQEISREPGLIFVSGILLLVAGLAIVRAHNIWAGGGLVVVTVLGWLAVLTGLLRMLFPTRLATIAAEVGASPGWIISGAVVLLVLGGFLSFKGYRRD